MTSSKSMVCALPSSTKQLLVYRDYIIERTTGPWMLWRSVRYFQAYATAKDGTLTILEPSAIYPINWREPRNEACDSHNETGTSSYSRLSMKRSARHLQWHWQDSSQDLGQIPSSKQLCSIIPASLGVYLQAEIYLLDQAGNCACACEAKFPPSLRWGQKLSAYRQLAQLGECIWKDDRYQKALRKNKATSSS